MRRYSEAAWERAMKVQEVILRAMAKRISWWQAAEIIGISDRSLRRWKGRYEKEGFDGLFDRRRKQPSPRRVPMAQAEEVLRLYQEKYADLNVRHFHEKLGEVHGIKLSYTWVKLALQGAGLVKKGRKRGVHRKCSCPCANAYVESASRSATRHESNQSRIHLLRRVDRSNRLVGSGLGSLDPPALDFFRGHCIERWAQRSGDLRRHRAAEVYFGDHRDRCRYL